MDAAYIWITLTCASIFFFIVLVYLCNRVEELRKEDTELRNAIAEFGRGYYHKLRQAERSIGTRIESLADALGMYEAILPAHTRFVKYGAEEKGDDDGQGKLDPEEDRSV